MINPSRLIKASELCLGVVSKAIPEYSSKYSRKDYTQWQLLTLVCIKERYRLKYREFIEILEVSTKLLEFLDVDKVPHFTTLNKIFLKMKNLVFSILLQISSRKSSGNTSIDSTHFDRRHASRSYTERAKMHIKSIKSTPVVDIGTQKVLDVHNTTTKKHDSQIMLPLIKKTRQRHRIKSTRGDCGYDDKKIRKALRKMGIRPLIKHREFKPIQKVWNNNMKKKDYNQRWKSETLNSRVKRKYGDHVSSKKWNNQFKEVKLKFFLNNIDIDIKEIYGFIRGFLQSNFN